MKKSLWVAFLFQGIGLTLLLGGGGGPRRAWAQDGSAPDVVLLKPEGRQGYFVEAFSGGSGLNLVRDDEDTEIFAGPVFGVRLGQMVTPDLGLGIRIASSAGTSETLEGSLIMFGLEGHLRVWRGSTC